MIDSPTREILKIPPLGRYVFAAEEDRCAPRHKVLIPAQLRFSGSTSFTVQVTDLSLAGFACDALLQTHAGTRCWLKLPTLAALEAETVHCNRDSLGCAFQNLLSPAVVDRFITHYPAPEPMENQT